jgi:purine-binding chemotaxis protein CheW
MKQNSSLENRFMELRLGSQLFAVPLGRVKEVIQKPEITAIPSMPSHFEGMINLRGQILGVHNLRKRLQAKGRETGADSQPEVVVVIEGSDLSVGMIVDEVTRVLHTESGQVKEAPLRPEDPASKFIAAVVQDGDTTIMALDLDTLLDLSPVKKDIKKAA